jgi:transposase-like protein
LRNWRLEFEEEERTGAPKSASAQEQEVAKLRREDARLREENKLLKKAAVYSVREST